MVDLYHGDCRDYLRSLPDNSVDSIVTDPPYGLSFMGKRWDYDVPSVDIWAECLRVLKPGGHLLAFAGTRTQHRMAVNIEDAGFEIRDMIAWVYGSGFPKSYNLRDEWSGWGTALKPALEPITVARKPLSGTVAENALKWGTGAINVDGCRVEGVPPSVPQPNLRDVTGRSTHLDARSRNGEMSAATGRWPANLIHDGSGEVLAGFPQTTSGSGNKNVRNRDDRNAYGKGLGKGNGMGNGGDSGSAARFFYCAKASKRDRDEGLDGMEERFAPKGNHEGRDMCNPRNHLGGLHGSLMRNHHPTVKPTALMRYLCRLVTPPGGLVLDPFMGSGSTGKAAVLEGFRFAGCELDPDYLEIARARIAHAETEAAGDEPQLVLYGDE